MAKMSCKLACNRSKSKAAREHVDSLKQSLEKRPKLTFGVFLFNSFTPWPSNFLFIA